MMLHKNKSQRIALIKYGLSAPLFILMLVLSSATINNSKPVKFINKQAQQVLSASAIETGYVKTSDNQVIKTDKAILAATPDKPSTAKNQPDLPQKDTIDKRIFTSVEQVPEFPGGMHAFGSFLAQNIKYPEFMRKNEIQGKVITSFIVEKDGSLTDIKILRAIGNGADEEAVRVLKLSPKWNPGIQNGKPVRVSYTVPITFALSQVVSYGDVISVTGAKKIDTVGRLSTNTFSIGEVNKPVNKITISTGNTFSVSGPKNPLIIVDGKEISDIKTVNPADIQTVNVWKDKEAVALYGNKAANGVILITTKKK